MTDWITDADHIRDTLDKYGPLTRAELADKTDLPRETLAKSLYALKKQGDVIEEGDRLMRTKATETAQDASEEVETGVGSTQGKGCATRQESAASDGPTYGSSQASYQAWARRLFLNGCTEKPKRDIMPEKKPLTPEENEKLNESIDLGLNARNAVYILSEAYWTEINELSELRKENEKLHSKIAQTEDFSGKYIALKEKLRGMLDE